MDVDAEVPQGVDRHVHIRAALHRGDEPDRAVALQQRQREQQPADELAAHIAGHAVSARGQPALHAQGQSVRLKAQTALLTDLGVHREGTPHQPLAAGQPHGTAAEQTQGDHEPQRAGALPAGQRRGRGTGGVAAPDKGGVALQPDVRAQSLQTVQRGQDILGAVHAPDDAVAPGQRGADQQPVRHGLGRRRGHFAPGGAWPDQRPHGPPPRPSRAAPQIMESFILCTCFRSEMRSPPAFRIRV